jgi:hypothetical protein
LCWDGQIPTWKGLKLSPCISSWIKSSKNGSKTLIWAPENPKGNRGKCREIYQGIATGNDFLGRTPKAQETKAKNWQLELHQTK